NIFELNKETYDSLAGEYQKRWKSYYEHQTEVLSHFVREIKSKNNAKEIKILDVGCGVGLDSAIMSDHGFKAEGIDFSSEMIKFARINVPGGKFVHTNLFDYDPGSKYKGVILDAFIHLFPKNHLQAVFNKIKDLTEEEGILYISTTLHDNPSEGFILKGDYENKKARFRKEWTKEEFLTELHKLGLQLIKYYEDKEDVYKKHWMNVLAAFS
ncbi:MAG: class I SAM-dependent methyltransferase, partial [Nanoarchaeota archaeon]|nr:class I SAM-dependent methyltransferase [Nanoarchaeota archaeon]